MARRQDRIQNTEDRRCVAQGSLEECRYYLILVNDLQYGNSSTLSNQLEEVSKFLNGYIMGIGQ